MEVYNKNNITIDMYSGIMAIRDKENDGYIECPSDNIANLLKGLRRIKKDPAGYKHHNCLNGHVFFPTVGCDGNFIILCHIPRIITAINNSNKISFDLEELHNLNLQELNNINMSLKNGYPIIKDNNNIDIIFYNI